MESDAGYLLLLLAPLAQASRALSRHVRWSRLQTSSTTPPASITGAFGAIMATTLSPTAPVLTSPSQRISTASHLPPNVSNVVLGNLHIKPWYPSFYPEETLGGKKRVDWLYVCQWCFRYTTEVLGICGHCVSLHGQEETSEQA